MTSCFPPSPFNFQWEPWLSKPMLSQWVECYVTILRGRHTHCKVDSSDKKMFFLCQHIYNGGGVCGVLTMFLSEKQPDEVKWLATWQCLGEILQDRQERAGSPLQSRSNLVPHLFLSSPVLPPSFHSFFLLSSTLKYFNTSFFTNHYLCLVARASFFQIHETLTSFVSELISKLSLPLFILNLYADSVQSKYFHSSEIVRLSSLCWHR